MNMNMSTGHSSIQRDIQNKHFTANKFLMFLVIDRFKVVILLEYIIIPAEERKISKGFLEEGASGFTFVRQSNSNEEKQLTHLSLKYSP